jgi:hypothetical protein
MLRNINVKSIVFYICIFCFLIGYCIALEYILQHPQPENMPTQISIFGW